MLARRLLCVVLLAGCGREHVDYAVAPLRETLLADPRDIASLPAAERAALRARFVRAFEESKSAVDEHEVDAILAHDSERELQQKDSALAVRVVGAQVIEEAVRFDPDAYATLDFDEDPNATPEVAALEARALRGSTAALITSVAVANGVTSIVRAREIPAAYVVSGTELQLNVAWLMAMATNESPMLGSPVLQSALTAGVLTTIDGCGEDIRNTCTACSANATCEADPVLTDFQSGAEECTALAANEDTAKNVCVALILRRSDVAACVARNDASCLSGQARTVAFTQTLRGKSVCRRLLDACATNPAYEGQITCNACTNACNNFCRINVSTGSCNTSSCSGPSASCSSCGSRVCNATPLRDDFMPWWTYLWGVAPLIYLWRVGRRSK